MCSCIFTLVFTYIMSVPCHQSPPHLSGCSDVDTRVAPGRVPSERSLAVTTFRDAEGQRCGHSQQHAVHARAT